MDERFSCIVHIQDLESGFEICLLRALEMPGAQISTFTSNITNIFYSPYLRNCTINDKLLIPIYLDIACGNRLLNKV